MSGGASSELGLEVDDLGSSEPMVMCSFDGAAKSKQENMRRHNPLDNAMLTVPLPDVEHATHVLELWRFLDPERPFINANHTRSPHRPTDSIRQLGIREQLSALIQIRFRTFSKVNGASA